MTSETKKIKVLIVDDSALVRQVLTDIFSSDPELEVIDTAIDPLFAIRKMQHTLPDVITLDVEMPRMDGLTFLQRIMSQNPIPVVVISSLTKKGTEAAVRALEYGAVEILTKPAVFDKKFMEDYRHYLCEVVKAASHAKVKRRTFKSTAVSPKYSADVILPYTKSPVGSYDATEKVIVIGASTGGTEALRVILEKMPADSSGIVIVQHMPEHFTRSFAERLDSLCKIHVKEAENGDTVLRGCALIAPGNKHTLLKRSGNRYYVEVKDGPLVNRHRPSVDVLFRSAARYAGPNAIGVILTGMGGDGAQGMLELKKSGARTIAQDEHSCVVFGMPKEAIKLNAVDEVLPLEKISDLILK